jgi:hypothetical protein
VLLGKEQRGTRTGKEGDDDATTGLQTQPYLTVLRHKRQHERLQISELNTLFETYYGTTDALRSVVDELAV